VNEHNNQVDLSSLKIDRSRKYDDRPRRPIWRWIIIVAVIAAIVWGYFAFRSNITPATSVKTATARVLTGSTADATLVATGYVVAQRLAEVASEGTGRLVYLGFEEGDQVSKGEVIGQVFNEDIKAQLQLAEANLRAAEVDTLESGRSYRRTKQLLDSGSVTEEQFESAEAVYKGALAKVKAADASVRSAQVALDNTYIRAPFDGTVLTKNAEVGEIVAPFASSQSSKGSVVTLADMNSLEVEADVAEANIQKVTTGMRCEIVLDAYPNVTYDGYVKKIVPTADRTRATVLTRVAFSEIDDKVLPEMSARIQFFTEDSTTKKSEAPVIVVPKDAITNRDGQKTVFRIDGDIVTAVSVETGRELGGDVEILSGLSSGDRVVLSPPGKMATGEKIAISK
jgi:RND family efflux transporter MFP subunit